MADEAGCPRARGAAGGRRSGSRRGPRRARPASVGPAGAGAAGSRAAARTARSSATADARSACGRWRTGGAATVAGAGALAAARSRRLAHRDRRPHAAWLADPARPLRPVYARAAWTSTSPPSTSSSARRSATSWRRRSRRSSRSTSASTGSRSRSSSASARWAGSASRSPRTRAAPGMDTLAYAIAVEEIGRVWGSLGLIVAAHTSLGCGPLHLAGTKEQKDRYLVPMASGKVIGAYGLTEPGAGSDAGGTRTTARWEGEGGGDSSRASGEWVIDGGKRFITNAGQAGTYIVTARTGTKDDGNAEISAFILPGRHARLPRRPHRGQARACTRRRPASSRSTAAASRPRTCSASAATASGCSSRSSTAAGSRSARWRSGSRRRAYDAAVPVRPDARAVRQADRQLPGRRVHDRRHGDRDRGRPRARLEGRLAQGPGPRLLARRGARRSSSPPRSARA